jgi:CO/xanthine dehydrogenase Mo-binding subunit
MKTTVGTSIKRVEDPRLLTGGGRYVDDIVRPGMVHAVIVRSAHAHARLRRIGLGRALAHPGVLGGVTGTDLGDTMPVIPLRSGARPALAPYLQLPLARERVRYVGEPVAVVVASDRAAAEDARELVEIDYDVLPAVVDVDEAASASAPLLFPESNVAASWTTAVGDVDAALRDAAHVVREQFSTGRQTGSPLETRGLVADWGDGGLTVWGTTKVPYFNRRTLAGMLGLDETRIHFVETDVGGGFGSRGEFYPEDFLIPWIARRLGRPVKWVEDRREHFLAINHSREQRWSVAVGVDGEGRLLAFDATLVNVMGAYLRTHGVWVASLTDAYLAGPYRIPNYRCRVSCVMTNKTPTGTVRGPGFFEGTFVRERALDLVAARLGLDPAVVRRRNLARPHDRPYTVAVVGEAVTGRGVSFGDEDFGAMFDEALEAAGYEKLRAACRAKSAQGGDVRYGVGLAAALETSGVGPYETAKVTLTPEGTIVLAAGATSLGQGPATTLAQVCGDVLQVAPEDITVHLGDTRFIADGVGSSASRSAVMAGNAVHRAAHQLREQIVTLAAASFEASPEDVTLEDGAAIVRGVPHRRCSLREVAALAGGPLEAECRHEASQAIGACAIHVAVVAVDVTTGVVRPEKYVLVCDVGRAINPMIVEGQLVGGIAMGLGHALMEELVYDAGGQLLTGTLMDYALPRADRLPPTIEIVLLAHAPGPNALGVKGAGETGTSGVGAALANAVADALGGEVTIHRLPLTAAVVTQRRVG